MLFEYAKLFEKRNIYIARSIRILFYKDLAHDLVLKAPFFAHFCQFLVLKVPQ